MSKPTFTLHTAAQAQEKDRTDEAAAGQGAEQVDAGAAQGASPVSQVRTTAVDLGGLMSVLGKHLYSTPVVALRELVQNAHDSIIRRRMEDPAFADQPSRITVIGDNARGIIRIIDSGAGLTAHEVHSYLATVGVGYTRSLREREDRGELIGMFGLGFLSAFVLSNDVTVTTTSFQEPELGWQYKSATGENYSLTAVAPRPVGTEVCLALREDFTHLAGGELLRTILGKYCILLREPVYLNAETTALNPDEPPWRGKGGNTSGHPVWLQRKRMEFASRFDSYFEPLCTIPIAHPAQPSATDSDAVGLLWVQDGSTYGTSDNRQLSVFGRGMLLDDDARDLLPSWAGFISGVVESNLLTPTASRESLQKDELYYATRRAISESLINGLAAVAKTQPEAWRRVLARHNEALLGASLCDDRLFDLLADDVRVRTSQGELPAAALRTGSGAVHVRLGSHGGFEDMLFKVLRTPVARGELYAVAPFLRRWVDTRGGSLVELGTEKGNRRLFTPEKLPEDELAWLRENLAHGHDAGASERHGADADAPEREHLVAARFMPAELPMVIVHDREAELKRRLEKDDADRRISAAALRLARNYTKEIDDSAPTRLYINLGNQAVRSLLEARRQGRDTAPALSLLRSLKVIMAAGGDGMSRSLDVNAALNAFCSVLAGMLGAGRDDA
ncbi:ATP-binding protein, partial [Desulfovibrio sp. OttesenSCG-928-A18]|nr:ATP-binding protein [Desulfovibrio sp. OttesenSCG-928-A18]